MDAQKILGADLLDILFEDRNKEYGAYDLRKTYPKRLIKALAGTAAVLLLLLIGYYLSNRDKGSQRQSSRLRICNCNKYRRKRKMTPHRRLFPNRRLEGGDGEIYASQDCEGRCEAG